MRELELKEELEKIQNDKAYARKALNIDNTDSDNCLEKNRDVRIEELKSQISKHKQWSRQKESGVPLRYQNCCFENFECRTVEEEQREAAVIDFVEQENNDGILLMTGSEGTGKTHLGIACVRETLGYYVTMENLMYNIEASRNNNSHKSVTEVFDEYFTERFLVIDEVGRSLKTDKEAEYLSYILRSRYDNMLPTVVISNLDKITLLKNLGKSVVDRMKETAVSIEFSGESYRIHKRKSGKTATQVAKKACA